MNRRLHELDSLRGLAALTVLLSHFMLISNFNFEDTHELGLDVNWYKYTPLHIFWAGGEAVILFFILSGFVLFLPFMSKEIVYREYLIKRIFRIYPASIISLLFAITFYALFKNHMVSTGVLWIDGLWEKNINIISTISDIFLFGYSTPQLNPVIWSLIHEIRLSFLFPIIAFLIFKYNYKKVILGSILISLFGYLLIKFSNASSVSIFTTIHFSSAFAIGALLAKHMNYLIFKINEYKAYKKVILLLIGVVLYTYNWITPVNPLIHNSFFVNWSVIIGASIFILISLSSKRISKLFKSGFFLFWGEISYSLYLYHMIILVSIFKLNLNFSLLEKLTLTFVLSVLFAYLSYKYIETPMIKLGKQLTLNKKEKKKNYKKIV